MAKHPMQDIAFEQGVARFRKNAIVEFLIDWCSLRGVDMNSLATMNFDSDDRSQFAQLIGYSVSGFGDLSYADPDIVREADAEVERLIKKRKRAAKKGKK